MEKKYRLTDETIEFCGFELHRIESLKDFGHIKKGDKGGFVQSENNLSHDGDCWIFGDAYVYGNANVSNNAKVYDNANVYGCADVFNDARIYGSAKVYDNAKVFDNANVFDDANVFGDAKVFGNTKVFDDAMIYGKSYVYDNAYVSGNVKVCGYAYVCGNVKLCDKTKVYDNAYVYGNVKVCGDTTIRGFAKVSSHSDYIVFKNWWSSGRYFTWTRSDNMWSAGCFYGTGKELIEKAYKDSELSGREYKRIVDYVESILGNEKIKESKMDIVSNQVTINKENIINLYNDASGEQKELLRHMFGNDMFQQKDIRDKIKTFDDALHKLGDKHELVKDYKNLIVCGCVTKDIIAFAKLRIIAEALNEGWKPTFDDGECRYYPFFKIYTKKEYDKFNEIQKKECHFAGLSGNNANEDGVIISNMSYMSSVSITNYGSRIALKTRELAEYFGNQFIDIWAEYLFA